MVFSLGSFVGIIILSINAVPELSVVWLLWLVSTAAYPFLDLPSSIDTGVNKSITPVPMQTVLIQHPDGTLNVNTSNPV